MKGGSPYMNYDGGDGDSDIMGGGLFCGDGHSLNVHKLIFSLVVVYVLYIMYNGLPLIPSYESEQFYIDPNASRGEQMRGSMGGSGYDSQYLTDYPTQSAYTGSNGYGRNY